MDPVVLWCVAIAYAALFLSAGLHKVGTPEYYAGVINKHIPLPPAWLPMAVAGTAIIEICTGMLFLHPLSRQPAAWCALGLLLVYLAVITAGLLRGLDVDCGCSGPLHGQKLSNWLVCRNLVLAVGAWIMTVPSTGRVMGMADIVIIVCSSVVLIMLYISFELLLVNRDKLILLRSG